MSELNYKESLDEVATSNDREYLESILRTSPDFIKRLKRFVNFKEDKLVAAEQRLRQLDNEQLDAEEDI